MQKIQFYLNRITFQSLVFISNILKKFETGRKINASLDSKFDFSYLFYRFFIEEDEINHWIGHSNANANFKISIVTPCFGMQALYLQELYQSLTIQDHTNWELCLCLDGIQPLDFENYVAKIVRQDKRVKTIRHETNLGISAATRSAVSIANGDAVLFADADDKLHKRALKIFAHEFTRDTELDFAYSDMDFCTDYGYRIQPMRKPNWSPELLSVVNYINHAVVARKSIIDSFNLDDLFPDNISGSQDWNFCFLASNKSRKIKRVPFILYHWRKRKGSVAESPDAKPYLFQSCSTLLNQECVKKHEFLIAQFNSNFNYELSIVDEAQNKVQVIHIRVKDFINSMDSNQYKEYLKNLDAVISGINSKCTDSKTFLLFTVCENISGIQMNEISLCKPPEEFKGTTLKQMVAYALQKDVACVWPFTEEGFKAAYTINQFGFKKIEHEYSAFGQYVGNVLAGPFHGLMIGLDKFKESGGFHKLAIESNLIHSFSMDHLSVALSINCLTRKLRNVSVPGITVDKSPTPIPWDHGIQVDPYVLC